MARYYHGEPDMGEREPLDNQNGHYRQHEYQPDQYDYHSQQRQQRQPHYDQPPYREDPYQGQQQQQQQQYTQQYDPHAQQFRQDHPLQQPRQAASPPRRPVGRVHGPGSHPDSAFSRLKADRRSQDLSLSGGEHSGEPGRAYGQAPNAAAALPAGYGYEGQQHPNAPQRPHDLVSPISPPAPPPHRDISGRHWGQETAYQPPQTNITPGADNFSEAAAGGMAGIAYTVAERNARESGIEAVRPARPQRLPASPPKPFNYPPQSYPAPDEGMAHGQPYNHAPSRGRTDEYRSAYDASGHPPERDLQPNLARPGGAAASMARSHPGSRTPSRSPHSFGNEVYTDDPYQNYAPAQNSHLGIVNPNEIEDDGDEGLEYGRKGPRTSMLSLGGSSHRGDGAAGAAAAGGVMGTLGGLVGRNGASPPKGGYYGPVQDANTAYQGNNGSAYDLAAEKANHSEWLARQRNGRKKWKWCIIIGAALVIAGAVAGGIVGGVVLKRNGGSSSSSAADDTSSNGDLGINSPEIQGLMNNPNLHKVFPGVDYTPINTQYPDCLKNPPSQNNVTRDVAVLSQLTNTIRLYGTDCNQTEMTIHAIKQLKMDDTLKIWMGVWQDGNGTTNARQLAQMWDIFDTYGSKYFKGVIVANEILFREQMTTYQLGSLLSSVRQNLTAKGMTLPVATSDLGDKWTADLAQQSDYVMANIHPFFAGKAAKDAAAWTYNFWENNNGAYFKSDSTKNVISETGWPSQGGTDCGSGSGTSSCSDGSVAGIDEMNQFMADWVCAALNNGTQYFWFEAFDEPWKIQFDSGDQNWEDHWGLMDVNRNLKSGVQIPDCGGKTV